jgi:hypothetical protein
MITVDSLKKLGGKISYTPVGVIRLEFAKDRMYHFFSEHAPPILSDNIHTHPHSFVSNVIKGGIRNHIYQIQDSDTETEHCVKRFKFRTENKDEKLTMHKENVTFHEATRFDTYAGGTYRIDSTTMHEIDILEPKTITLLTCTPYIAALTDVYFLMKKEVSYTREQLHNLKTTQECWEIVADTLA